MGEGWREGERWTCSHTPLPWGEVTEGRVTPGPSAHSPSPSPPPPSSASWGMVVSEGYQRRVCSLNPRPALLNFSLSLFPTPQSLLNLIYAAPGRDRHPTWSLNSWTYWTRD